MKTRILLLSLLLTGIFAFNNARAEEENREVSPFSGISLRISGKVYLKQGAKQSVKVVAKEEVLGDIITEVNNDKLIIRFTNKVVFQRNFNPGKIEIYVTVPDVNDLSVSGSGDIIADELNARILNLALSGSGGIKIGSLESSKVKGAISGSGNIEINDGGVADELNVTISGSGNCNVNSNGSVKARIAGSGNVYYRGNPSIDASVAGSGKVKKM
jgi:hypothetical protein